MGKAADSRVGVGVLGDGREVIPRTGSIAPAFRLLAHGTHGPHLPTSPGLGQLVAETALQRPKRGDEASLPSASISPGSVRPAETGFGGTLVTQQRDRDHRRHAPLPGNDEGPP